MTEPKAGRPPSDDRRTHRVVAKFNDAEIEAVRAMAEQRGLPLGVLLRTLVLEARKVQSCELVRLRRRVAAVAALRKRILFYCHPDRGGDEVLMKRLNVLFDDLEAA